MKRVVYRPGDLDMARKTKERLTHILACVEAGTLDEVLEIIGRLHFLPEFGKYDAVKRVSELAEKVCAAELALAKARSAFRLNAEGLVKRCLENWSPEEIEKATGYSAKVKR
jgi:hypothetical protein